MLKNYFFVIFSIIILCLSCFPERRDKNLVLTHDFYKDRHYTITEYINKEDELYIHINENIDHYYHVNSSKEHVLTIKVTNSNKQLIYDDTLAIGWLKKYDFLETSRDKDTIPYRGKNYMKTEYAGKLMARIRIPDSGNYTFSLSIIVPKHIEIFKCRISIRKANFLDFY